MNPADIKVGKMAGCAGGCTASAPDTPRSRWFHGKEVVCHPQILMIIVEDFLAQNFISKIFRHRAGFRFFC
jgi:hypothetical protein